MLCMAHSTKPGNMYSIIMRSDMKIISFIAEIMYSMCFLPIDYYLQFTNCIISVLKPANTASVCPVKPSGRGF